MTDNGPTGGGNVNSFARTFTVTVNPVNDAPTITGQVPVSTAFNTSRTIVFSDLHVTDIDNSYPAGFTLTTSDGMNYTRSGNVITPAHNFFGNLTVPVKVNDGALDSITFNFALRVIRYPAAVKIEREPGGGYRTSFIGNPGTIYTVQFSPGLAPPNWQFLGTQSANPAGNFFIIDNPPIGTMARFYRAIVP